MYNGFRPLVQHAPISQIQDDIANSIQWRTAALEQHCQQQTMPSFVERLWHYFCRLIHGTLEQCRCSLGSQADQIMQTTDTMDTEFLAASLRPDAVTMRLDPDETLVPY